MANWKGFKNWLDQNIMESDNLLVKVRANKQDKYGELSTQVLTDFCDSLEATLDNNPSYHLFPTFSDNESFKELFNYQDCYFGKKTNQEKINKDDYELLEKMFKEWKTTQNTTNININDSTTMNTRNILLIGRTGSGKSSLGNVLINKNDNFEEVFGESSQSVSETRSVKEGMLEVDISKDGSEKIKYRIIDTIGLGDTKLTPQGVLTRLAEVATRVKKEGLNHILFVTQGRFSKEEIEAYDLLSSIIFDSDVLKYTTIVRTNFPSFEKEEACANDRAALRMENADLAHILGSVNVVYVDNPPLEGRQKVIEMNKETREESRKRLLTYLAGCQGNYRPSNIDELDQRVHDYKTNEQKLKDKMKELERARKEQEEEFRKKLANLKEEQAQELRENRRHFEEKLHKTKIESDEKLRTTVNDLEDKQKKKVDELEEKNKEQLKQSEEKSKQEIKKVEEAMEKQKKDNQEDLRKSREKMDRLQEDLNKKNDNTEMFMKMMEQNRKDEQARQDRAEEQRRVHELQIEKEKQATERKRIDAETQWRKDEATKEATRRKEEQQAEAKRQEIERKKARMDAAWRAYEVDNKAYLEEQENKFWGIGRDDNWRQGIKKPSSNLDDY